jgi:hypothetical protein
MYTSFPSAQCPILIEVEVGDVLLAALQKASALTSLSSTERFEIAGLTFMAARALCRHKHGLPNGQRIRVL